MDAECPYTMTFLMFLYNWYVQASEYFSIIQYVDDSVLFE